MLDNFKASIEIMGLGMLGIFTVIIIISLLVIALEKLDRIIEKTK